MAVLVLATTGGVARSYREVAGGALQSYRLVQAIRNHARGSERAEFRGPPTGLPSHLNN